MKQGNKKQEGKSLCRKKLEQKCIGESCESEQGIQTTNRTGDGDDGMMMMMIISMKFVQRLWMLQEMKANKNSFYTNFSTLSNRLRTRNRKGDKCVTDEFDDGAGDDDDRN